MYILLDSNNIYYGTMRTYELCVEAYLEDLKKRGVKSYYARQWLDENGVTFIDYGSHTHLFKIIKISDKEDSLLEDNINKALLKQLNTRDKVFEVHKKIHPQPLIQEQRLEVDGDGVLLYVVQFYFDRYSKDSSCPYVNVFLNIYPEKQDVTFSCEGDDAIFTHYIKDLFLDVDGFIYDS